MVLIEIALTILFILGITMIVIAVATIIDCDPNPIRDYRIKHTPSCGKCAYHVSKFGKYYCSNNKAIDYYECVLAKIINDIDADKVRGTKLCNFKTIEEKE